MTIEYTQKLRGLVNINRLPDLFLYTKQFKEELKQ